MSFLPEAWRSQPSQIPRVLANSAATIGLKSLLLMSVAGQDVVQNRTPSKDAAASFVGSAPYGISLRGAGGAEGLQIGSAGLESVVAAASDLTVMMLIRVNSLGTRRIFVADFNSGGTAESLEMEQRADNQWWFHVADTTPTSIDVVGGSVSLGWHWVEMIHTIGTGIQGFVDGSSIGTSGTTLNRRSGTDLRIGRGGAFTSLGFDGDIAFFGAWARVVPAALRFAIRANPWQLFEPYQRRMPGSVIAGAADVLMAQACF